MDKPYFVYMLRCTDNSLYTGFTTDWKRRFEEHREGGHLCAKYTLSHPPLRVERVWQTDDRRGAMRLEYRIKTLTHVQKEWLIADPDRLEGLLGHVLDCSHYQIVQEVFP